MLAAYPWERNDLVLTLLIFPIARKHGSLDPPDFCDNRINDRVHLHGVRWALTVPTHELVEVFLLVQTFSLGSQSVRGDLFGRAGLEAARRDTDIFSRPRSIEVAAA